MNIKETWVFNVFHPISRMDNNKNTCFETRSSICICLIYLWPWSLDKTPGFPNDSCLASMHAARRSQQRCFFLWHRNQVLMWFLDDQSIQTGSFLSGFTLICPSIYKWTIFCLISKLVSSAGAVRFRIGYATWQSVKFQQFSELRDQTW